MVTSCKQCAWLAAATLVLLRVAIGIHFFREGKGKLDDPQPFSAGFFSNAKGPLAPLYKGTVWDPDGRIRLGLPEKYDPSLSGEAFQPDPNPTLVYWENYRDRVIAHYGFDDARKKEAERITKDFAARYRGVLSSNREEIEEYYHQLGRRDANAQRSERRLDGFQIQEARITSERMKLRGPQLATIDALWKELEEHLNNVATAEQRQAKGRLPIGRVKEPALSAERIDAIIPYFDLAVGICLIVGLFTRTAAVLAGLFLLSVCSSQWPGYSGSMPVYYQAVEMLALFALAANGAGRYASIDAVLGGCCRQWCCPPKQGETKCT